MHGRDARDTFARLWEVAATQAGYFTTRQAHRAGYSNRLLTYHTQQGDWDRIERAIYRLRRFPPAPHEDLVRWALWTGGLAVVSHETALAVHEIGDVVPGRVHLTVPPAFRKSHPSVVLHRKHLPPSDIQEGAAFRITTPARTLLDCAQSAIDEEQLIAALRDALRKGAAKHRDLAARIGELSPRAAERFRNALLAAEDSR